MFLKCTITSSLVWCSGRFILMYMLLWQLNFGVQLGLPLLLYVIKTWKHRIPSKGWCINIDFFYYSIKINFGLTRPIWHKFNRERQEGKESENIVDFFILILLIYASFFFHRFHQDELLHLIFIEVWKKASISTVA